MCVGGWVWVWVCVGVSVCVSDGGSSLYLDVELNRMHGFVLTAPALGRLACFLAHYLSDVRSAVTRARRGVVITPGITVMWAPRATAAAVLPRVGCTPGRGCGRVARGGRPPRPVMPGVVGGWGRAGDCPSHGLAAWIMAPGPPPLPKTLASIGGCRWRWRLHLTLAA